MKRRTAIKTLGGISLAGMFPSLLHSRPESRRAGDGSPIRADVLVVGGGTAGVIAAIQSARAGCKTILLENGSQLGGTMTTGGVSFPGIFHAWGRQVIKGIGWELVSETVSMNGDALPDFTAPHGRAHYRHQLLVNAALYAMLAEEKCLQAGVSLRYYETPVNIQLNGELWEVDVVGKGVARRIVCNQLVDCTGNALVTSMAGHKVLRESETQPGSLIFEIDGYDINKLDADAMEKRYKEALKDGILKKTDVLRSIRGTLRARGGRVPQHVMGADSTTSESHTLTNINGRASLLRIMRFIKSLPGCEKAYVAKMQPETAVRETCRIDGIYQITEDDYVSGKVFDDSLSYSYYPIDLHVEGGVTPRHLEKGKVATIPFRALIPRGSKNLLAAGRCISSDRLANSALRVQASCMGMGQAAGVAAALASQMKTSPMNLPIDKIKQMLKANDAIVP